MTDEVTLKNIISTSRHIAVVGLSDNPQRPSFRVAAYLKNQGYLIYPVNPGFVNLLGEKCYPDLVTMQKNIAPTRIDIVDIFRRSQDVPPHVDEAISIGARVIWMQEGIEHIEAARQAEAAGLRVVMNRCLMKEHRRLVKIN